MNELVFLESNNIKEEPFTTDEIIAKYSGNSRSSVTRLIRVHKRDWKSLERSDLKSDRQEEHERKSIG